MIGSSSDVRQSFLTFFQRRGHVILPSAPLVPERDTTILFTPAGMHPLIPYLLGEAHPLGRLLTDIQKCIRTDDIEEVGDDSHLTFFEMLGFWSLGDYWKQDSLRWTLEWFTQELGLEQERISVTVFAGDEEVPRDEEAAGIWLELGIPRERIYYQPKADNWWPSEGQPGPCGPDSELFYDTLRPACGEQCQPGCHCGKYIEIGNNVFMQYNKTPDGDYIPLVQRNIDVGLGLERIVCVLSGSESVYATDLFVPIMLTIDRLYERQQERAPLSPEREQRLKRVIADHLRAVTFLLADGIVPSNVEHGYVCRRLLRRAMVYCHELSIPARDLVEIVEVVLTHYQHFYPELEQRRTFILAEVLREEERFARTLERGLREFQRVEQHLRQRNQTQLEGRDIFRLFDTFGFPPTLTAELLRERGLQADLAGFQQLFEQHRQRSRQGSQARFKGGPWGTRDSQ